MKIVLVVHIFFPHWRAGTEVYTLNLARSFRESGHQLQLVCYEPTPDASAEVDVIDDRYDDLPVHRILFRRDQPDFLLNEYFNPAVERHLIDFYRQVQPDIVHVIHSMHLSAAAITAAQHLGIPVVCTATDFWYICPTFRLIRADKSICRGPANFLQCMRCYNAEHLLWNDAVLTSLGRFDFIARILRPAARSLTATPFFSAVTARNLRYILDRPQRLREILSDVDTLILPNENTRRLLVENGVNARNVLVQGYGLSLPAHNNDAKKVSPKLRLAYIGTLDYAKGVHVLLEAMRLLSDKQAIELKIYGDPSANPGYSSRLKEMAGSDERIRFSGTFPNERIAEIFSEIDLLVIPSLWYENTPLVLYSAFATQTPVMVSKIGSLADAVHHGANGLVFEMGNPDQLAEEVRRVLEDPSCLDKLRKNIPPVKSINQNAQELLEIYAALSAHPAVTKPRTVVPSLSRWLQLARRNSSFPQTHLGLFERAKIVFRRRKASFDGGFELRRCQYAFDAVRQLSLRFVWRCSRLPDKGLTVMVQFQQPGETMAFQTEHQIRQVVGDYAWATDKLVAYSVSSAIPEDLKRGSYSVRVALWNSVEQQFVPPLQVRGWRQDSSARVRMGMINVP